MKTRMLALLLLSGSLVAIPTHQTFASPQSEKAEEMAEAKKTAVKADKELNTIYKKLMATLDEAGQKNLIKAQRAWIKFRDAEAEKAKEQVSGGHMRELNYLESITTTTNERVKALKKELAGE